MRTATEGPADIIRIRLATEAREVRDRERPASDTTIVYGVHIAVALSVSSLSRLRARGGERVPPRWDNRYHAWYPQITVGIPKGEKALTRAARDLSRTRERFRRPRRAPDHENGSV